MPQPDWEGFGRALMELVEWPANSDVEAADLFELCQTHHLIREIPGGYQADNHIDAYGISPEDGDPWYEFNFPHKRAVAS